MILVIQPSLETTVFIALRMEFVFDIWDLNTAAEHKTITNLHYTILSDNEVMTSYHMKLVI